MEVRNEPYKLIEFVCRCVYAISDWTLKESNWTSIGSDEIACDVVQVECKKNGNRTFADVLYQVHRK
jgi:hypothetical protein